MDVLAPPPYYPGLLSLPHGHPRTVVPPADPRWTLGATGMLPVRIGGPHALPAFPDPSARPAGFMEDAVLVERHQVDALFLKVCSCPFTWRVQPFWSASGSLEPLRFVANCACPTPLSDRLSPPFCCLYHPPSLPFNLIASIFIMYPTPLHAQFLSPPPTVASSRRCLGSCRGDTPARLFATLLPCRRPSSLDQLHLHPISLFTSSS